MAPILGLGLALSAGVEWSLIALGAVGPLAAIIILLLEVPDELGHTHPGCISRRQARCGQELDLQSEAMDLTLTPLSKSRAIQVPSTVRVVGPLSNLQPEISPISAVLDTYSAWLTLVPQLALEVFGFKGSAANKRRPCQA